MHSNNCKETFLEAGFGFEHPLEVFAMIAASTITNYAGNAAEPPLEADFHAHAWSA
ncbi:hypothetical protein [Dyella monticola]|uniref:hypothetical protein n=1 Tax=Dyella monticola TaxID=1927958 RepID=UPI001314E0C3|nr:hypothetical protein [Dyella monticola]